MNTQFKYFAFISYNAKDTAWGKRENHPNRIRPLHIIKLKLN